MNYIPNTPLDMHSPLPWKVTSSEAIKIADGKGNTLALIANLRLTGRREWPEVEANAALIVKAVNLHQKLINQIIQMEDCLGSLFEAGRIVYTDSLQDAPYIAGHLEEARAILEEAGVES